MNKYKKTLTIIAYSAVIAMTLVSASYIGLSFYQSYHKNTHVSTIKKGDVIPTLNEDWSSENKTLILVLSTTCEFCTGSADFYKTLISKIGNSNHVRIVAVFPQKKEVSEEYLQKLGVKIELVKQAEPKVLGVKYFPTVILVDNKRRIIDSWEGQLNTQTETNVLEAVVKNR